MSEFNYTQFPIPARPLSGVGETTYPQAVLAIAPGGVKKVSTSAFLTAAGVYPLGFLQCQPDYENGYSPIYADTVNAMTRVKMILYNSEQGAGEESEAGLAVDNNGEVSVSNAGIYRISAALRVGVYPASGGSAQANLYLMVNGTAQWGLDSSPDLVYDGYTLQCPPCILNLDAGDTVGLYLSCVGTANSYVRAIPSSEDPSGRNMPDTSYLIVERLTNASGAEPDTDDLAELTAEVEDIREAYDGTVYDSAGASVRAQIQQGMTAVLGLGLQVEDQGSMLGNLQTTVNGIIAGESGGQPTVAESSSDMTDHTLIYVYMGETDSTYTHGHMYYWNQTVWEDSGMYGVGQQGEQGATGATGATGAPGWTYVPSISNGVISWTRVQYSPGVTPPEPQSYDLVSAVISALPSAVGVSF